MGGSWMFNGIGLHGSPVNIPWVIGNPAIHGRVLREAHGVPWVTHGTLMSLMGLSSVIHGWVTHEKHMGPSPVRGPWENHGRSMMGDPREIHGSTLNQGNPMEAPWESHGGPVGVPPWETHEPRGDNPNHGSPVAGETHGPALETWESPVLSRPMGLHCKPMGDPWAVHESPMGDRWVIHGKPWPSAKPPMGD